MAVILGFPVHVYAANGTPTRATPLDIDSTTQPTDQLNSEGWKWEPSGDGTSGTLTLRDCYIQTELPQNSNVLHFGSGLTNVTIHLEGDNTLEATNQTGSIYLISTDATITFTGNDDAYLHLVTSEENNNTYLYGIYADGISFQSGNIECNAQLAFVDHRVEISGGSVTADASRIGGSDVIYSNLGPVVFSGGVVDLTGQHAGVYISGIGASDFNMLKVAITGGNVSIRATGEASSYAAAVIARYIDVNTKNNVVLYGTAAPFGIYDPGDPVGSLTIAEIGPESSITWAEDSAYGLYYKYNNTVIDIAPADYAAVNTAKANADAIDRSLYTEPSLKAVDEAVAKIDSNKTILEQDEVDAMADTINEALNNLEYLPANYSAVDAARTSADNLDRTLYTDNSLAALDKALDGVHEGLDITHQDEVDAMAAAINEALDNLEYLPADYSAVDAARTSADNLDRTLYTDNSLAALDKALDGVHEGLDITHQDEVDAMAAAINEALDNLEYLPADYSAVDAARTSADKIDRTLYTADSLAVLDKALSEVREGLDISHQGEVDAMAAAINEAINNLEKISDVQTSTDEESSDIQTDSSEENEADALPATSDDTVSVVSGLVAGIAGALCIVSSRRFQRD